jgi:hypothetical protein
MRPLWGSTTALPSRARKVWPGGARSRGEGGGSCTVPVLYLILKFLEDLAGSGGSDPA